jgi:hypothetical protein
MGADRTSGNLASVKTCPLLVLIRPALHLMLRGLLPEMPAKADWGSIPGTPFYALQVTEHGQPRAGSKDVLGEHCGAGRLR